MAFFNASDETGKASFTLFPKEYSKYNNINVTSCIKVYGKVEKRYDEYKIVVDKIEQLKKY